MTKQQLTLLRNSERSTYRRCRLKHHWTYTQKLAPPRTKGALSFGTLVHEAMAEFYPPGVKRGPHPARTFERLYKAQQHDFDQWTEDGERYDALELGVSMLEGYVKEYGSDDHIEILQPEMSMQIDVCDRQGNYLVTWVGTCDAAYRNRSTGRVGLLEHKTAKTVEEELRVNSGYGEQGLSYWWAANIFFHNNGMLGEEENLEHVLFNWLRKGIPDPRPINAAGHRLNKPSKQALMDRCEQLGMKPTGKVEDLMDRIRGAGEDPLLLGEPSKTQPKPLYHRFALEFGPGELESINKRIRAEAWEISQVRKGKLPLIKNPTKDCSWDCPFKEPCEIHEMGGDFESVLELEFGTWDPYSDHELLEEKA